MLQVRASTACSQRPQQRRAGSGQGERECRACCLTVEVAGRQVHVHGAALALGAAALAARELGEDLRTGKS